MTQEEMYRQIYSGAHVPEETRSKIMSMVERGNQRKSRKLRPAARTALIVIAAALVLTATAMAVAGLNLGEIPESIRRLMGIGEESVPGYISYENVSFAENAAYTDVRHVGVGELYANFSAIRSENLYTLLLSASTVTKEQYEDYVWRLQIEGSDQWAKAKPNYYQADDFLFRPQISLQAALILDPEFEGTIRVRLCGGYESEDGKSFDIQRVSAYSSQEIKKAQELVSINLGDTVSFENTVTGEKGYYTKVEISDDKVLFHYYCPGSYELYNWCYEQNNGKRDDWKEKHTKLMGWPNGVSKLQYGASIALSDGTVIESFVGGAGAFSEDDMIIDACSLGARQIPDPEKVVSITIGGETFYR